MFSFKRTKTAHAANKDLQKLHKKYAKMQKRHAKIDAKMNYKKEQALEEASN